MQYRTGPLLMPWACRDILFAAAALERQRCRTRSRWIVAHGSARAALGAGIDRALLVDPDGRIVAQVGATTSLRLWVGVTPYVQRLGHV